MARTELKLSLFGTVSAVSTPGAGAARIGTQISRDITAGANNPVLYDSLTSADSDTWDFSAAAIDNFSLDTIAATVAGETPAWPAKGWLIECDVADTTNDSDGYAIIAEGDNEKRLYNGGCYLYLKSGGADATLNAGTTVTGGAIEADDNIYTKAAHGFVTGDRVSLDSLTGGTGLTAGNYYFFHRLSSSTGYLCSTYALAVAGTAINVTVDASAVVLTNTATEVFDILGISFDAVAAAHENLRLNIYAIC